MNHDAADGDPVKQNATAAILGVVVGYLVHRHWPEIESLVRLLVG
jgi:hypothetical protein